MIKTSILCFVAKPVTLKCFLMPVHSKKYILCSNAAKLDIYTHIKQIFGETKLDCLLIYSIIS